MNNDGNSEDYVNEVDSNNHLEKSPNINNSEDGKHKALGEVASKGGETIANAVGAGPVAGKIAGAATGKIAEKAADVASEAPIVDKALEKASNVAENVSKVIPKVPGVGAGVGPSGSAANESFSANADGIEGETLTEQAQNIQQKATTVGATASAGVSVLSSPPFWVIVGIVLLVVGASLNVISLTQTLGKNSNACKNKEDCSVAQRVSQCQSGTISLSGKNNIEKTYNYIVGKGYPAAMAAGIAGNFMAESGGVPWVAEYPSSYVGPQNNSSVYDGRAGWVTGMYRNGHGVGGWGIGQWSFGRHAALRKFIEDGIGKKYYKSQQTNGTPPMSVSEEDTLLAAQLDFLIENEKGYEPVMEKLKKQTDPAVAAKIFHDEWERSAGWSDVRATNAVSLMNTLGGGSGKTGGAGVGVCTIGGDGPGSMPAILQQRWAVMKSKSGLCQLNWTSGAPCAYLNQCPKVVDALYGGAGRGRGYGNGKDVAQGMINAGVASQSGDSLNGIPAGAVISFDWGNGVGHVAIYAGNGMIWGNDFGCSGKVCEFKIVDSPTLKGAKIKWALPKPSFDLGGKP